MPLAFFVLNDSPTHVVPAFRANGVSRNGNAALWAVTDLTLLHVVVRASLTRSAVGMFAFWDSHR